MIEITACEGEHWIWKEGWPQPGDEEKGKGGKEAKGGHEISDFKQLWTAAAASRMKTKNRKIDKNSKNDMIMLNSN